MTVVLVEAIRRLPQRTLLGAVRAYRLLVSPALGASCRFEPSCSAYAIGALEAHGAAAGSYLTLRRIVRCAPWCPGGHDPVPDRAPGPWRFLSDAAARTAVASSCSSPSSSSSSPTASPRP